ncbi:hypothetical protein SPM16_22840, partial [Enterobacter hormaechei subsp. xiangfangensis]
QQGDGGGVFGDSQFTSTLSVNFHFPKIPRRTKEKAKCIVEFRFVRRKARDRLTWPKCRLHILSFLTNN